LQATARLREEHSYAIYEGAALRRAVLINSKAWLKSDEGVRNRTVTNVGLSGLAGNARISIKRLAIGHADDDSGLLWGGVSYETSSGRPQGRRTVERSRASRGVDIQGALGCSCRFRNAADNWLQKRRPCL
jgi:hypothetical protein